MDATVGVAEMLAREGVLYGYTVDGILPFEGNVENFNASRAALRFDGRPSPMSASGPFYIL